MKKIAVLTSGRADYSIYYPLLKSLEKSKRFDLNIIAFGSHLSHLHGYTINLIKNDGFTKILTIDSSLSDDQSDSISVSMGLTQIRMSELWKNNNFDLLVCIGDRYEMFAAVSSSLPFNLKIMHLHGGEKTLGAIDNSFRHAITAMSNIHITSCNFHKDRVIEIIEDEHKKNVYNVGAPALHNIHSMQLLSKEEFATEFNVDLNEPTILFTYHPETINLDINIKNIEVILSVFDAIKINILVTLPNSDSMSSHIRKKLIGYSETNDNVFTFNYLGVKGYYSAIKHCSFMMGNSSSGIIEAASLGCRVINIGERQKGRHCNDNVIHCDPDKKKIIKAINEIEGLQEYNNGNIYYQKDTINKIIEIIGES
ncbi:UDP-N-acetylglucosamine 2-epimerase [Gammaproteobacteria bacterium]|nr:UDP-N-acetylglucosamine 2-epimerase [Gammaproteobacteria bacterium]